ncbi:hypothetical protein [Stenotrophomonas indicatrix]|uniref:hypothetical protein n=1 Tax=Stenotrophomonas indicatrix TaxID=2045451 RepID=UPI001187687E|nr:hypothetical protein [Stenotrophomonas indicatrix]
MSVRFEQAFLRKPKLKTPTATKARAISAASAVPQACDCCGTDIGVLARIHAQDAVKIKGLEPPPQTWPTSLHASTVADTSGLIDVLWMDGADPATAASRSAANPLCVMGEACSPSMYWLGC